MIGREYIWRLISVYVSQYNLYAALCCAVLPSFFAGRGEAAEGPADGDEGTQGRRSRSRESGAAPVPVSSVLGVHETLSVSFLLSVSVHLSLSPSIYMTPCISVSLHIYCVRACVLVLSSQ